VQKSWQAQELMACRRWRQLWSGARSLHLDCILIGGKENSYGIRIHH
jgi:hypothetical protein